MSKNKKFEVYIHFDNKKYTHQEELFDKVMFFMLLQKIQLRNDYKEVKISKEKYTSEIQSCENITNYIKNLIKSDN